MHDPNGRSNAGISTTTVTSSSSKIKAYGVTYNELKATGLFDTMTSTQAGLSRTYSNFEKYYYHNGNQKTGELITSVNIAIKDRDVTQDAYKSVCTHELGHSLGWAGHTPGSTNIMYHTASSITSLTYVDKRHLIQVY